MFDDARTAAAAVRYVPILKAKEGEYKALTDLKAGTKAAIVPLLEVPSIPWDWASDAPAKGLDAHIAPVIAKITAAWGTAQPAYLDADLVSDERTAAGKHPLEVLFADARTAGLTLIPVAGTDRSADDLAAVAAVAAADGRGICLRLVPDDFLPGAPLAVEIATVLAATGVDAPDVDLIVDLGALPAGQAATFTIAWTAVLPTLPRLADWRTVTLAGTAFPISLSGMPAMTITSIAREEWHVYQGIRAAGLPRVPDFGDYAIAHPDLLDVDPRLMQMSAAIRYAAPAEWLVVKGRGVRRNGWNQTQDLSRLLIARPESQPATHCAGCDFIRRRAAGSPTPGNGTTWRYVGTVHHLTTVVEQLTSLTGP